MGMLDLIVAFGEEMDLELFVGEDVYLRKTINATVDLHHDITVDGNGGDVIDGYDGIRYKGHLNTHVFKFLYGGPQIKILDISRSVYGAGGRYDGVKVALDGSHTCGGGRDVAFITDAITTYGKTNSFWFSFL